MTLTDAPSFASFSLFFFSPADDTFHTRHDAATRGDLQTRASEEHIGETPVFPPRAAGVFSFFTNLSRPRR
jgi:hypothetical protein